MRVALATAIVAVAAMLVGTFGPGLDTLSGRVIAAIGVILLWVPLSWLLRRRGDRRRDDEAPGGGRDAS